MTDPLLKKEKTFPKLYKNPDNQFIDKIMYQLGSILAAQKKISEARVILKKVVDIKKSKYRKK